jgi:hypothetical protein
MSVRTMARVWEHSQQTGTHLLMMLAIADFADDDGRAYPSVNTLAKKCRMKPRNANVILAALRASGELKVMANQGPKAVNVYRIKLNAEGVQSLAGVQERAGVQSLAATPAKACPDPCKGLPDTPAKDCRQTISEPSLNHQEPPERVQRRKGKAALLPLPEGFSISPQVETWAIEHGHARLPERLEDFVLKAQAKNYQYASWDAAFKKAIREDWAKLNDTTSTKDVLPSWKVEQLERNKAGMGPAFSQQSDELLRRHYAATGQRPVTGKHTGFATIDYTEGVSDDGRIT